MCAYCARDLVWNDLGVVGQTDWSVLAGKLSVSGGSGRFAVLEGGDVIFSIFNSL